MRAFPQIASGDFRVAIRMERRNHPHMMTPEQASHARAILPVAIVKAKTNATQLARDIGSGKDYIRDFLRGRQDSLGVRELQGIAERLHLSVGQILGDEPRELSRVPFGQDDESDRQVYDEDGSLDLAIKLKHRRLAPGEIPERNVVAGLGHGGTSEPVNVDGEVLDGVRAIWKLPIEYIRTELRAREPDLDIIAVDGDSMIPTLQPGDRVIINRSQSAPSPDGLYAIFDGIGVSIKRLELVTGSKPLRVRVISDNKNHGAHEIQIDDLNVIGRVIMKMSRL
jgi:transcriptional regulator with XRE-family HTH domain